MAEYIMKEETDMNGVDCYIRKGELIRCKDCKHIVEHEGYGNLGESAFTCEGNMDGWVLPDGYCNYAERREE